MAVREPEIIEMYANGREYGTLTKAEIAENWEEMRVEDITDCWRNTCDYLSKYTDSEGLCRLDLEKLVDGGAPDYTRDVTVCAIIYTLMDTGKLEELPEEILERAAPYISARIAEMDHFNRKLKRMENFAVRALRSLNRALDSDCSLDECFEYILSIAPSPGSYSVVKQRYKDWYLPLFETLQNAAKLCSTQIYAEAMERYVEAMS